MVINNKFARITSFTLVTVAMLASSSVCAVDVTNYTEQTVTKPLPGRPAIPFKDTDLPDRPVTLSAPEQQDLSNLVAASREKEKEEQKRATDTRRDNREMLGTMPQSKSENELINDTVTGAIAESDIANARQNKMVGDFYYVLVSASMSDSEILSMMADYNEVA